MRPSGVRRGTAARAVLGAADLHLCRLLGNPAGRARGMRVAIAGRRRARAARVRRPARSHSRSNTDAPRRVAETQRRAVARSSGGHRVSLGGALGSGGFAAAKGRLRRRGEPRRRHGPLARRGAPGGRSAGINRTPTRKKISQRAAAARQRWRDRLGRARAFQGTASPPARRATNAVSTSALVSETASQSIPAPLVRTTLKPRTVLTGERGDRAAPPAPGRTNTYTTCSR